MKTDTKQMEHESQAGSCCVPLKTQQLIFVLCGGHETSKSSTIDLCIYLSSNILSREHPKSFSDVELGLPGPQSEALGPPRTLPSGDHSGTLWRNPFPSDPNPDSNTNCNPKLWDPPLPQGRQWWPPEPPPSTSRLGDPRLFGDSAFKDQTQGSWGGN